MGHVFKSSVPCFTSFVRTFRARSCFGILIYGGVWLETPNSRIFLTWQACGRGQLGNPPKKSDKS